MRRNVETGGVSVQARQQWRRWVAVVLVLLVGVVASACSGSGGGGSGGGDTVSAGGDGGGAAAVKDDGKRREIATGTDGPSTPGEIVAKSADEWAQKWAGTGATAAAPDVSDVDFEKEVAVGIFAGEKPTGGWKIGPNVEVKVQGRFGAVSYEVIGPGEGCQSTQALTSPYLVLAVKASTVRFTKSEKTEPCK